MFRFFDRFSTHQRYQVLGRYKDGHWFKSFELSERSPYLAAREFDQNPKYKDWIRVSGATLITPNRDF